SANSEVTRYLPTEVKAYRFNDDRGFEAREVPLPEDVTEIVFIEALVKGTASLYRLRDLYYIEKGTEFHRLSNDQSIVIEDGSRLLKSSNRYIGLLIYLLGDCDGMQKRVEQTRLNERKLTELIEAYNVCKGDVPVVFKESKQWMVLDIGPMVGYQMSSLTTNVMQDDYDHLEGDFDKSGRLFGGLHLNFTFPRLNERLSLVTGLIY